MVEKSPVFHHFFTITNLLLTLEKRAKSLTFLCKTRSNVASPLPLPIPKKHIPLSRPIPLPKT